MCHLFLLQHCLFLEHVCNVNPWFALTVFFAIMCCQRMIFFFYMYRQKNRQFRCRINDCAVFIVFENEFIVCYIHKLTFKEPLFKTFLIFVFSVGENTQFTQGVLLPRYIVFVFSVGENT